MRLFEQSFYGDFGIYAECFTYMGFDPRAEMNNRYFAIGISSATTIDPTAYGTATNSGLNAAACPANQGQATLVNASQGSTALANWFAAGKGNGDAIATTVALLTESFLADQSNAGEQRFTIQAAGVVSADYTATGNMAKISVDENKQYSVDQPGY